MPPTYEQYGQASHFPIALDANTIEVVAGTNKVTNPPVLDASPDV
jgi:hypothetical protein